MTLGYALLGYATAGVGVAVAYLQSQPIALGVFGILLIVFYWAALAEAAKVLD